MDTTNSSTQITKRFKAPINKVYKALIEERAIAEWMVPTGMKSKVHFFESREGGKFRISLTYDEKKSLGKSGGNTDTYHGWFVKLIPNKKVVERMEFETTDPQMKGEMTTTFLLTEIEGETELLAKHEHLPPGLSESDNQKGWELSLENLAGYLKK